MKKIIISVIAILAALGALAFNSNNKVNNFFTQNNGTIYNQNGLSFVTKTMNKGLFSSSFETQFGVAGTMLNLTHSSSFNPFSASVKSIVTLPNSFMANESKESLQGSSLDYIIPDLNQLLSKYLIIHAKSELHSFFTINGGKLYNKSGLLWKLESQNVGDFNATYETSLNTNLLGENIIDGIKMRHVVTLNEVNATLFNIGSMMTTFTMPEMYDLPELSNKEYSFNSTITFGGFDSNINIPGGTFTDDYYDYHDYHDYKKTIEYKDINISFITSFDTNMLDFDLNVPLVVGSDINRDNESIPVFELNNLTFKQKSTLSPEVGFWVGGGIASIGKIIAYDRYSDNNSIEFSLENFSLESNTKLDNTSDTVSVDFKTLIKGLMFKNNSEMVIVKNFDFDFAFESLDAKSIKKFYEVFENIQYPYDDYTTMLQFASLAGEVPKILEKKPRILLNNLSAEYGNETHSAKGFIEYNGTSKIQDVFSYEAIKDIYGKFDVKIGENVFKNILKDSALSSARWSIYDEDVDYVGIDPEFNDNYELVEEKKDTPYQQKLKKLTDDIYNEKIKYFEELGIKAVNGYINFIYEIKNGMPLVNGNHVNMF